MKKTLLILLTALLTFQSAMTQNLSNRGKEFWLGYGFNYGYFNDPPVNQQELAIYISTIQAATVTVSINSTGWTQTLNIPANTVNATITIPKSGINDARILTDGLSTKGIHIVSDVPVAVYAHVYALMVSGATMLMPVETWGYKYYSVNYYQTKSQSSPNDWYSWFYVVATENNTRVEITPADTTKNGWLPGTTHVVNLNKGEIYNVFGKAVFNGNADSASKDMTGSKIVSIAGGDGNCHPVGVFSGSGGIRLCRGDGGEFMQQQIFPLQAWGTRYLTHHTLNNTNTNINATFRNYYRICVSDPTTVVKRNGVTMTGLVNNFFYEYMDSTGGDYYTSDKPILISQYTPNKNQCWNFQNNQYGDPEMIYLSPLEQGQNSVLFYSTHFFGIDYVYSNITIPTAGISSLLVDGAPLPASQIKVHPNNPAYSVAFANLTNNDQQHTITSDSNFTAIVYGLGYFESYGYNVGTMINNLNAYPEIKNVNGTGNIDSFTCKTTPFRMNIKLAYPVTSIHWKLSQVPGLSPNTDSIINNPVPTITQSINGRTYYNYTLQQIFTINNVPGTYNLPVTYTHPDIDNCNNSETAFIPIVVKTGPVADFSYSNANCLKDTVHFIGTSNTGTYTISSYLWNFDDATTQTTVNANKLFAATGTQNVRYRIYANNGCVGDTTKVLNIQPTPTAVIGVTNPTCEGQPVQISDTSTISSGSIASWNYDFGDGNTLIRNTNTPFFHTYLLSGTFTIKLVTVSNNGCPSDTAYKSVTIFAKPLAKFGYSGNICMRDSIYITDTSSVATGTIVSWRYDFGDGNTLVRNTNTGFYHAYINPGSYVVSLVTISNNGCVSDTFRRTVSVMDKPTANFSVAALNCLKDTVYFTHIPTSGAFNITGYLWNFDDATTQNTIDAKKKFLTPGIQNIRYRVFADNGCFGDTTKTITLYASPVARLGVTTAVCADSVMISDTSTITVGSITNWEYDFGDGNTLNRNTNTNFYHRYLLPGTYTIWLVTTSNTGCKSDTSRKTVTVTAKPLADFTALPSNCLRDTIDFIHVPPPGSFNITGYLWNFDDGSSQTTIDARKIFSTAGVQNIRYRIFTLEGCISDTTKQITINPDPVARLGAASPLCAVDSVMISDTSSVGTGNIVSWRYDFGDGNTLVRNTNTNFYHRYAAAGTYTISLVVVSDKGCFSDTVRKTVTIVSKPTVSFNFSGTPCTGSVISFTSSYTGPTPANWYWNFGDGQFINIPTGNTSTHIYTLPQTSITVKHVVTNAQGCASDTATLIIPAISQTPTAAYTIKKDTVCENMPILFTSALTGISNWTWNFGNGTGSNIPPFTRIYSSAGNYPVSLVVISTNGCVSAPATDNLTVNPIPVVYAGTDKIINLGSTTQLDASVSPASSYSYTWSPALNLNSATVLQPIAKPSVTTVYTLTAESTLSHCKSTDDVQIKIIAELYIPNAFTPNGDGKNDKWNIPNLVLYPKAVVTIYNRYGTKIYETSNYTSNPWDGTVKGVQQPSGTYVYIVRMNDFIKQVFNGTVTIIR